MIPIFSARCLAWSQRESDHRSLGAAIRHRHLHYYTNQLNCCITTKKMQTLLNQKHLTSLLMFYTQPACMQ